jgi:cytoskeleton protein RodZ
MTAIGETLRRERLRRNLDLDEISRELKISHKFLEAIEGDRFEELPGGVFAKSFVRQYARLLALDEEELAGEVQRTFAPSPATSPFSESSTPAEIRVPRVEEWRNVANGGFSQSSPLPALALVVVMMLVCSAVYAWWQRPRHSAAIPDQPGTTAQTEVAQAPAVQLPQPQAIKPQTSDLQTPGGQATPSVPGVPSPPAPFEAGRAESAQSPAPTAAQNGADQPVREAVPSTPVLPAAASSASRSVIPPQESVRPASLPVVSPKGPVQVAVTADIPVWVLATTDGKFSFSGTIEKNQTRILAGNSNVRLRLGNAGAVSITLNGKPVGAVGPKGQVRTVQFTSGGFQIVAAPKPSLLLDDIL